MNEARESLRARVMGIVRGREIDDDADVHAGQDALSVSWQSAMPWELSYDGLDGLTLAGEVLTLYLSHGDVLEVRGAQMPLVYAELQARLYGIPEFTRGLRSLGSRRGTVGPAHDRWFAPLLSARRAVVEVHDPMSQLHAFDAGALQREYERIIGELATEAAPAGGAAQRALEAALEEEAEALHRALRHLDAMARQYRESPRDAQLAGWREWINAIRLVFAAADESWPRCARVLAEGP